MSISQDIFEKFGPNAGYIRDLYQLYKTDPALVGETWATFFSQNIQEEQNGNGHYTNGSAVNGNGHTAAFLAAPASYVDTGDLQQRIYRLVSAYRNRGHLKAKINPLSQGVVTPTQTEDIQLDYYNFTQAELESEQPCAGFAGLESLKLRDLIAELDRVYCGNIGFEYNHLLSQEERLWLQGKIESRLENGEYKLTADQKIRRLQKTIDAEAFENELHKKYVGQKRFSLQGGETTIPMLNTIVEGAGALGVKEAVIGMAHRGRLNVLRNIFGKALGDIFSEFEDQSIFSVLGSGDVKYHMGFESVYNNPDGEPVRLTLAPNPSHLEFVNPVVEGIARAKQDLTYNRDRRSVLPILIHGDAAFIGQGCVTETLNMANVEGYATGGTIHLVINNQVGFTTSPDESRSSTYCTDFAKAIQAPIMHINCENIEAACWAASLALDFRLRYQRDVVLDLYCYRRYGHNEGDDPSYTQPIIYKEIEQKKNVAELYAAELVEQGVLTEQDVIQYYEKYSAEFSQVHEDSRKSRKLGEACAMHGRLRVEAPETGTTREVLSQISETLVKYPKGFTVHPKLGKILEKRASTLGTEGGIDWGFAEGLAFGALMQQGVNVRLSGQDCGRGTFSQRHLVLNDYATGEHYIPFSSLADDGYARFEVLNSTLSETSVMGFEFGYSAFARNRALVMWEAQFGDFANGAQVIIDQFLCSSEQKWNQLSGLVLLLPHGYEGQGPEHSSARLERFLQLCADGNMVVCMPSNAAQHFHMLRRHGLTSICRPLIVMTPKSLLRAPEASCHVEDLVDGGFQPILVDDFSADGKIDHVVFCSGKVFYDIKRVLDELKGARVKVVRLEQLYPFPQFELKKALKDVKAKTYSWVQEEPRNMGAWSHIHPYLEQKLEVKVEYTGRVVSASTATGSGKAHVYETQQFLKELLERVQPQAATTAKKLVVKKKKK